MSTSIKTKQSVNTAIVEEKIQDTAKAIRWIVIGSLIAEYGAILLPDCRGELKMRANGVKNQSKMLQQYFLSHPNASQKVKEVFKKEFSKNEIVLLGELLETVWGVNEDGLEEIIKALKNSIIQKDGTEES
jgi:hypothetical protein